MFVFLFHDIWNLYMYPCTMLVLNAENKLAIIIAFQGIIPLYQCLQHKHNVHMYQQM